MLQGVKLLYHSNYWDGPLSGVCEYQGKRYWFDCLNEDETTVDEDGEPCFARRRYGIYELTEEEWEEQDVWHRLFETYVGTHTNYNEQGERTIGALSNHPYSKDYYWLSKKYRTNRITTSGRKCLGEFTR